VIVDETVDPSSEKSIVPVDLENVRRQVAPLSQETVDDFAARNKIPRRLASLPNIRLGYVVISKEEIEEIFRKAPDGWKRFYERYPSSVGFVGLSRVGFDSHMNEALVYMVHGCGWTCGSGRYFKLVKKDRTWVVDKELLRWIS
jgi:hypothetical protein